VVEWPPVASRGNLVVGRGADGRLVVLAPGRFMSVLQAWQEAPNGAWGPWSEVPLSWASPPAAVANDAGRLELFAPSSDAVNHVWQTSPDGEWSRVEVLFGVRPRGRAAAGRNEDGRLEVFVCGERGEIEHNWQREANGEWVMSAGRWPSLQGLVAADDPEPLVARNADGRLELFVRGADGDTHHASQRYPNGGFGAWQALGVSSRGMPAVGLDGTGRLALVATTEAGELLYAVQRETADGFEPWTVLATARPGLPAVCANADGRLEVFVRGDDGALHQAAQQAVGAAFGGWRTLRASCDGDPAVARGEDGSLEVLVKADDGAVHHCRQQTPGGSFAPWQSLGVPTRP